MRAHHDRRAACPPAADAVVKYEIVGVVEGDGTPGSAASPSRRPPKLRGSNVRAAGEEARAGEARSCDAGEVHHRRRRGLSGRLRRDRRCPPTRRPRVAIIAIGQRARAAHPRCPAPGKIRNSNGYAHGRRPPARRAPRPAMLPIVEDSLRGLEASRWLEAVREYDLVVTSGRRVRWRLRLHQALRRADR